VEVEPSKPISERRPGPDLDCPRQRAQVPVRNAAAGGMRNCFLSFAETRHLENIRHQTVASELAAREGDSAVPVGLRGSHRRCPARFSKAGDRMTLTRKEAGAVQPTLAWVWTVRFGPRLFRTAPRASRSAIIVSTSVVSLRPC